MPSGNLTEAQGSGLPATLFGLSSQAKNWSFSAASLSAARLKSNVASAAKVRESLAAEAELQRRDLDSSNNGNVKEEFKDFETLSPEEQLAFTRYWESKIMNYCTVFRLDRVVQATAITLFKRFYILHTVMDYDPRVFLMTALFLACKVEGSALSLKEYLSKVPNAPSADRMMDLETQLCTGLRFQLKVHHPFSPLHGFFLDFQVFLQGLGVGDVSKNEADEKDTLANRMAVLVEAFHKATERVTQSLLTDACLLYSPSQIGLACLSWSLSSSSSKGKDVKSIEKAFDSYLSQTWRDEKPETVLQLRQRLDEINRLIEEGAAGTSTEMARSVDAKLKRCRNLYLVETSLVFKDMQKKEEEEREASRTNAKRIKREDSDDVSPFI